MAKILFLEDEKIIREVLSEYMTVAGHSVTELADGDEAVEAIDREKFDIALLDIRVSGKTGLEVLSHIRSSSQSDMGVIMLTAFEDVATQVEAFNHFADEYIVKPASPIILIKRIETLLNRINSSNSSKNEYPSKGFYIDMKTFNAYYDGNDLSLTLSELMLAKALSENPGIVFSREQLIEEIYKEDYFGSDRIIDAHIKNLRKKLPDDFIQTVIGVGYKWRRS